MADTGLLYPTGASAFGAGNVWTGGAEGIGTALNAADAVYAQSDNRSNESSQTVTLTGYGVSAIPDGATIDGIQVQLLADGTVGSGTSVPNMTMTVNGQAKTLTGPGRLTGLTVYSFGSSTDTWGIASLGGAAFKAAFAATFKLAVPGGMSGQAKTRIDYIRLQVWYTENNTRRSARYTYWL